MKSKLTKIILKGVLIFPIGFGFISLLRGFDPNHWVFPVFAGFIFSFGVVFWNLFDYEKFDKMDFMDFLESKHEIKFNYNVGSWNKVSEIIKNPFAQLKVIERTEGLIKVEIDQRFFNSVLTAEHLGNEITIRIKKKYITFLPDSAENYRILQKVNEEINTIANKR